MDKSAWISLASCIIAFFSAVWAFISSNKSAKAASAQLETSIRSEITNVTKQIMDLALEISKYNSECPEDTRTEAQKSHMLVLKQQWKVVNENYLNTVEEACSKYLDNKIDKVRFKKSYINELGNIAKKEQFHIHMHPQGTSNYKAIWKVYEEWFNLEN